MLFEFPSRKKSSFKKLKEKKNISRYTKYISGIDLLAHKWKGERRRRNAML